MSSDPLSLEQAVRDLEQRVSALFEVIETLTVENRGLRQAKATLAEERTQLQTRNEEARARLNALIARLAELEESPES